jgi:hypothetical protein
MRQSIRRILTMGTGGILVWTALVAMPLQALAGSRAGYDIGIRPLQASAKTPPVSQEMATACQTHCQAAVTSLDALRARARAAQVANDPIQMRTVLDEVLQQQTAMQDHMAMCMDRMGSPRQGP